MEPEVDIDFNDIEVLNYVIWFISKLEVEPNDILPNLEVKASVHQFSPHSFLVDVTEPQHWLLKDTVLDFGHIL